MIKCTTRDQIASFTIDLNETGKRRIEREQSSVHKSTIFQT